MSLVIFWTFYNKVHLVLRKFCITLPTFSHSLNVLQILWLFNWLQTKERQRFVKFSGFFSRKGVRFQKLFFSQNRGQNNPILPTTTLPFLPGDARLMKTQKSCTSPLQIDANECVFGTAVLWFVCFLLSTTIFRLIKHFVNVCHGLEEVWRRRLRVQHFIRLFLLN